MWLVMAMASDFRAAILNYLEVGYETTKYYYSRVLVAMAGLAFIVLFVVVVAGRVGRWSFLRIYT